MKKIMIIGWLLVSLLGGFSASLARVGAKVVLDLPEGAWASEYEGNARCILVTQIQWHIEITGDVEQASRATFMTSLHMQYNRTCAIPPGGCWRNMSYQETLNKRFDYTVYTGMYYAEVEAEYLDENGKMQYEEERLYFYVLTPPIPPEKQYIRPYSYPRSNARPRARCRILNYQKGSDREISGPVVKFQIWGEDDGDLNLAVVGWKIMTKWQIVKPVHPPNYNAPAEQNQYKTYIPLKDIVVQEWDTRKNPSDIHTYVLTVYMIDEHGRFGAGDEFTFTFDPDGTHGGGEEPPQDVIAPVKPKGVRFK